jgi:hypothetical protein
VQRYSDFFSTLYDETEPVAYFGHGTHYSILRAVITRIEPVFHDFAVIWDEDHDTRVIWIIEKMFAFGLIQNALFIGERKGHITVLTQEPVTDWYEKAINDIAQRPPSDCFSYKVEHIWDGTSTLIQADDKRARAYCMGIDAIWTLGSKPVRFTTEPFHDGVIEALDSKLDPWKCFSSMQRRTFK